jgi:CheY-like chemotaxis protein
MSHPYNGSKSANRHIRQETHMRILIAEDDQVLADGLLRTLRSSGAVVSHVANGSEADTALADQQRFDLLILDLGLPKVHGLEVLKRLRGRGDALPVLILTAADRSKSASGPGLWCRRLHGQAVCAVRAGSARARPHAPRHGRRQLHHQARPAGL